MVTARNGLDPADPNLLLHLANALKHLDAASAHAVISALHCSARGERLKYQALSCHHLLTDASGA